MANLLSPTYAAGMELARLRSLTVKVCYITQSFAIVSRFGELCL